MVWSMGALLRLERVCSASLSPSVSIPSLQPEIALGEFEEKTCLQGPVERDRTPER